MSININKEKAVNALEKLKQTYEKSPFRELIYAEINRPNLLKFLEERIKESGEWKMNILITEYFNNFNKYPEKIINVLVVENHSNLSDLNENGYFKNPNNTLVLCLNQTFSTNKENGKKKSHFDYWRTFVSEALDYVQNKIDIELNFIFAGNVIVHDFAELISDKHRTIILPDTDSICYKDKSLESLEFASEIN